VSLGVGFQKPIVPGPALSAECVMESFQWSRSNMRRFNVVSPREDAGVELYPIEGMGTPASGSRAPPTTLPVLRDIEPHCLNEVF
jgi:hypothetical protein